MEELKLCINARRSGYSVFQCPKTINVGELKEILEQYADDTPIYVSNDNGYTFGEIKPFDIEEKFFEEDEEEEEEEE